MNDEFNLNCPHCGEEISEPDEMEVGEHNFIEDCEYCGQPFELLFTSTGNEIIELQVREAE